MKGWSRIATTLCLSIMIAFMLAFLPKLKKPDPNSMFVSVPDLTVDSILTGESLVDHLAGFPFELKLYRVEWSYSALSVDFLLEHLNDKEDQLYDDLAHIVSLGFFHSSNVKQVYLRVLSAHEDRQSPRLLMAFDGQRTDVDEDSYTGWRMGQVTSKEWLEHYLHFTYTDFWKRIAGQS